MLSFSKLYRSYSTSGPSTTSYPIPTKMRSTSSSAIVFGCLCPTVLFLDGSVTSMTSAFIFSSRMAASIFTFVSSKSSSIAALVSLTNCPTFGRSSGATSFIPFNTAVNSPFFPRNFTRTSFSFSGISEALICSKACALICSSLSFIFFLLSLKAYFLV